MRHNISLTLSLVCVLLLGSCQKEIEIIPQEQEFVATLSSALTKTTVTDEGKVSWEDTDAIGIFDDNVATPVKATIKSISPDGKTAVFTPATEITKAVGAIYPYDPEATLSGNVISISLGTTRSGEFADANIAASKPDGYNLSFKNVTSVFKFKVTDENAKSIKLSAPGIAGTLDITLGNTISASLNNSSTVDEITVSNITPGTDYYIAIAPKAYDDFQYAWYDNGGEQLGTASLGKKVTIGAGELFEWGDLVEHEDAPEIQDETFAKFCIDNFDDDGDGVLSKAEMLAVTEMTLDVNGITTLSGIEGFENLETFSCYLDDCTFQRDEQGVNHYYLQTKGDIGVEITPTLTTIDLSHNLKLAGIKCHMAGIQSLILPETAETLEELKCACNNLTSLDISANTSLETLWCNSNQLTSLDVSKNTALAQLLCGGNKLTSLDVSKNTALTYLDCGYNQLTSVNFSNNTALTELACYDNQLTSLDVSNNIDLIALWCYGNQLTVLDISNNIALTDLYCYDNQLSSLDVSKNKDLLFLWCYDNQLTFLDISKNTDLTDLRCYNNQISSIYVWEGFDSTQYPNFHKDASASYVEKTDNVPFEDANFKAYCVENFDTDGDGVLSKDEMLAVTVMELNVTGITSLSGIEGFENLERFTCYFNGYTPSLTTLDLSKNRKLIRIDCHASKITSLLLPETGTLKEIQCQTNNLTSLDVSNNTSLCWLYCYDNQLTSLDLSKNTALESLVCDSNQLTSLDVSTNTALTELDCTYNRLTSLDVSKNTALTGLWCKGNQLTSLDVNNTALNVLHCGNNQLTSLDVSKNKALTELQCGDNQLTSLDVSGDTALDVLHCGNNQLTSLDVSDNTALRYFGCEKNKLASLDVSKNTALRYLGCDENKLASLDVSKSTALDVLQCDNNQLTFLDVSNTALTSLDCQWNLLTSLDISTNTALTNLNCYSNQITSIYVWKGFDSTQHPYFRKDSSAQYVEVGNNGGNIENYNVVNPWN